MTAWGFRKEKQACAMYLTKPLGPIDESKPQQIKSIQNFIDTHFIYIISYIILLSN